MKIKEIRSKKYQAKYKRNMKQRNISKYKCNDNVNVNIIMNISKSAAENEIIIVW